MKLLIKLATFSNFWHCRFINARRRILQPMMNEAAAQNRGGIRNTPNKRIKLNIPTRRDEHCWSKSPNNSPTTPVSLLLYAVCCMLFGVCCINAFHSYKLKQILLVVHPGFGQDMPA